MKDKEVRGVRLMPGLFFSLSTIWGMYYYSQITQLLSFVGITLLAMANTAWIVLAVYYTKIKKESAESTQLIELMQSNECMTCEDIRENQPVPGVCIHGDIPRRRRL